MSHRKRTFRRAVQTLETRRCMAGGLGLELEAATTEPSATERATAETLTITQSTIVGNTADASGGGFMGGVYVASGDITGDGPGGGPHVKVFDGVSNSQSDSDGGANDLVGAADTNGEQKVRLKVYTCPSDQANVDAVFNEVGRSPNTGDVVPVD